MHVELASLFTAGMNVYLAVAPGHDGILDEGTMQLRRLLRRVAAGAAAVAGRGGGCDGRRGPAGNGRSEGTPMAGRALPVMATNSRQIEANLRANGYLSHRLIKCAGSRNYEGMPPTVRTVIVPDRAQLTPADAEMLDAFVRRGGKVLAFGRGMGLAGTEEPNRAAPMFGLHSAGYVLPGWMDAFM